MELTRAPAVDGSACPRCHAPIMPRLAGDAVQLECDHCGHADRVTRRPPTEAESRSMAMEMHKRRSHRLL